MGKGSTPRPFEIPREQFRDNWEAIFGKKDKPKDNEQPENKKAK